MNESPIESAFQMLTSGLTILIVYPETEAQFLCQQVSCFHHVIECDIVIDNGLITVTFQKVNGVCCSLRNMMFHGVIHCSKGSNFLDWRHSKLYNFLGVVVPVTNLCPMLLDHCFLPLCKTGTASWICSVNKADS